MNRLHLQHLAIEVASPRKTTGPASPGTQGLLRPGVCHRPIFDVLKHVGYVGRFDIICDDPPHNIRTVRYIVKLLRKLDIPVHTFCLMARPKPQTRQDIDTAICRELFNYLVEQRQPGKGAAPGICESGLTGLPQGERPTVVKHKNGRLVILDAADATRAPFENCCPVFMARDNRVFGCIRLDTRGVVWGCGGNNGPQEQPQPLCPASRLLRYLKSTLQKGAVRKKSDRKSSEKQFF